VKQESTVKAIVFCLLVAIGVAGRWGQPDWCFTPLAAVTLFAGYYFANRWAAALVPLCVMSISDLILPAYDRLGVLIAVYAILLLPVMIGRALQHKVTFGRLAAGALLPATAFWLASNFAVWSFGTMYSHTFSGLMSCYYAAIPFFRTMLVGDLIYMAILFASYVLATSTSLTKPTPATERA